MAINYAQLKTELQTDPSALGYSALLAAGNHVGVAAVLNLTRAGVTIKRDIIPAHQLFEAITATDYAALTAAEKTRLQIILSMGQVNVRGDNTRAQLAAMFGAGTATRTAVLALIDRQGSRAEQLFGSGVSISAADVALALAS